MKKSILIICLLMIACMEGLASANHHHHHRHHHHQHQHHHREHRVPRPPTPPPIDYSCSTDLIYVDGCVKDLISSFFDKEKWIYIRGSCCRAISGISDDCFQEAFTQFNSPDFTRSVRDFCAKQ